MTPPLEATWEWSWTDVADLRVIDLFVLWMPVLWKPPCTVQYNILV